MSENNDSAKAEGWVNTIKCRVSSRGLVPHGQMVTAVQEMLKMESRNFRGWNADLCMRCPLSPRQVFQIKIIGKIIHQEELDMLSIIAEEYNFNYFLDFQNSDELLIRCCERVHL